MMAAELTHHFPPHNYRWMVPYGIKKDRRFRSTDLPKRLNGCSSDIHIVGLADQSYQRSDRPFVFYFSEEPCGAPCCFGFRMP